MLTLAKRIGVTGMTCLVALGLGALPAQAQFQQQINQRRVPPGVNPFFQVAPGLTIGQVAYNTSLMGQAYAMVPPYALGYNPYLRYANVGPTYAGMGGYGGGYPAYGGLGPYNATLTSSGAYGGSLDPYNSGYGYPGSGYGDPYGGYLHGEADVVRAWGSYLINQQQANQTREQVRQAKVDTRRRVFDEYLYERANAPTWEDDRERLLKLSLRRSQNDPPLTEIWSGKALNDLLADVQKHQPKNGTNPELRLDEDLLKRINVAAGPGNVGLLKNDGKLTWPLALRTMKPREKTEELRQQISSLLPEAINQAVNGKVDPMSLKELARATDEIQDLLTRNVTEMPPGPYMEAKRFLANLDAGIKLLQQPDAGLYFTQKYSPKGKTIQDLVSYMTKTGLLFAPAVAGDEAAYVALHRALVSYDVALRGGQITTER